MIRLLAALTLSIGLALPASAAPSLWRQLAVDDVDRLHQSVVDFHPGMRDRDTPDFAERVKTAYRTAKVRAESAANYADWLAATRGFMLSFRDGHTIFRPNLSPVRVRWPGFLIDGRASGWVVRRPAGFADTGAGPVEGARIVACDGIPIADLLKKRLDGIEADWSKEPERIRQAYRLFLDTRNDGPPPISACSFEQQGAVKEQKLAWNVVAWSALSSGFAPYLRRIAHPIAVRTLASGGQWVSLGSFGNETKLEALAKSLEGDPAILRSAPFVVFDLRGNNGGNSTWGERFASLLWGEAAVAARTAEIDSRPGARAGKYFRATPAVAKAARATADEFKAMGPDFASVAGYWYETADRIAAAPDGDRKLVHDPCCDRTPPTTKITLVPGAYARPVYVLIDAGCFSSCVVAANRLVEQGAIAVGETSGQNEEYGEVASPPPLPSGLAEYLLPISIIRQPRERLRVEPKLRWTGTMDADDEIENWIAQVSLNKISQLSK
ncbi:MAG: hypothetical protein B7Y43_15205 [Sphingomonas sp. 28-62-20]|uniref:S41 family peptidase n=1 Tax=Sphingomonas sp. 28-62-20 TaxID=1970433 RepID=UPI000BD51A3D|nr:MAG: hypothetical protein B7Y43_15205 [Sphingomonas sp. 28-62-20]